MVIKADLDYLKQKVAAGGCRDFRFTSIHREITTQYFKPILNYLRMFLFGCKSEGDIEELTTDVITEFVMTIKNYNTSRPLVNWLMTIARNSKNHELEKYYRAREIENACKERDSLRPSVQRPEDILSENEPDPVLDKALKAMEQKKQELYTYIFLHYFCKWTFEQISKEMKVSEGTVANRLEKGIEYLRQYM